YRQVLDFLDGIFGLEETIEQVKIKTRQFAKRQRSWFRNQMKCRAFEWKEGEPADICSERLSGMLR
ncbi:MAG: tRNA (adenosine(37)-N6)-dimethylallyltransferase MiaA, partial [Verrucomicrobiota bacterium]|nr:tRNA (adenosine(37)-N6)-dimethylallyltransferase MiaA [Verrucomicrobiota bacterium]